MAFFMYLGQLKVQISALNTAVERLEQHLVKVSSGLAVLEGMGRAEIRARLILAARGLIADSELGDVVVREWLKDLDREVPGEDEGGGNDISGNGGGGRGGSAWEERVQWEKKVFWDSILGGFEWVRERLVGVENGVKAAEVKLGRLVERGVLEEVLFPRLDWGGIGVVGGEELGGKTPRVTVVECRGEMERLGVWIGVLRDRYLMGASTK